MTLVCFQAQQLFHVVFTVTTQHYILWLDLSMWYRDICQTMELNAIYVIHYYQMVA